MKITAFDDLLSHEIGTGEIVGGSLGYSGGSNGGFATDLSGSFGNLTVIQLGGTVALGSNLSTGVNIGDVLTIIQTSPTVVARFATPSNSSLGSNAMTRTLGGQGTAITVAASGAAYSVDVGGGNYWDVTLTANATISFRGWPAAGVLSQIGVRVTENGTGGHTLAFSGVTWIGGTTPSHVSTANTSEEYEFWSDDGGATIIGGRIGGSGSSTSPLTTKGDIWGYSTTDARFAVGSNGDGLIVDSSATFGFRWTNQRITGELLMQDGVSAPPVPLESDPGRTDWLYEDL